MSRGLIQDDEADLVKLIRAGVPNIDDTNTEAFTPHMLNLDKLGAISFSKGCYTGQEVVARTEHLGQSKRRLMRYEADLDGIAVGDKLSEADRNVGEVVNVVGRELLAVTPVELHKQPLKIGAANRSAPGPPLRTVIRYAALTPYRAASSQRSVSQRLRGAYAGIAARRGLTASW